MQNLEILNSSDFYILEDNDNFIFYNPVRHYACRLTPLDLSIFNLIFKHRDINIILSNIPMQYHKYITDIYELVEKYKILNTDNIATDNVKYNIPDTYYLHLTYSCNLDCTYCYNKSVRKHTKELSLTQWKSIINNIIPFANRIVLTGGEPFIYKNLPEIVLYIRKSKPNIRLEIISNCMINFKTYEKANVVFDNINSVSFSCDNISGINQPRTNFNVNVFYENIAYVKANFTKLNIVISSVYSKGSKNEQRSINSFCKCNNIEFRSVLIVPPSSDDISLLPPLDEYTDSLKKVYHKLPNYRKHCGAGVGVLSIAPNGNLYPCQSLMYPQYLIGNLCEMTIENLVKTEILNTIRNVFCVENIPKCKQCKLRYLCAGGCRAAAINLYNSPSAFPANLCAYYREKYRNALSSIPQMSNLNILSKQ